MRALYAVSLLALVGACSADPRHPKEFLGKWKELDWYNPALRFHSNPAGMYDTYLADGSYRVNGDPPADWYVTTDSASGVVKLCTNPKGEIGRADCREARLRGDTMELATADGLNIITLARAPR